MDKANRQNSAKSWNTYWEGAAGAGAYTDGGVNHPAVSRFWNELFATGAGGERTTMLDVATGNGAVIELAVSQHGIPATRISCVDISPAAIADVESRFPGINALIADAAKLPFDGRQFSLVTSQFGVEYAGRDALFALHGQVAANGKLALILHAQGSSIHDESAANLAAVTRLQEARFIPLATDFFEKGFAAVRGADRAPYDEAGATLAGAVQAVEDILREFGPRVAGDTVARLYDDVSKIHGTLPRYDPAETRQWLDAMDREIRSYAERMRTMIDAAIDESTFDDLLAHLRSQRFAIQRAEPLKAAGQRKPVAWVLVATRETANAE
jgi:SAM-dependent methyltransferase